MIMCLSKGFKNILCYPGIKQNVDQSALFRANENRDWRIFADFGEYLINQVRPLYAYGRLRQTYIKEHAFNL